MNCIKTLSGLHHWGSKYKFKKVFGFIDAISGFSVYKMIKVKRKHRKCIYCGIINDTVK